MLITPAEAQMRLLNRYGINKSPMTGDLVSASEELRENAPFVEGVDLDNPPDGLLDWVALRALTLSEDEPGPVTEDSMNPFTRRYAVPEHTQNGKRLERLLRPYLAHKGSVR
jgi:hypothetical protein